MLEFSGLCQLDTLGVDNRLFGCWNTAGYSCRPPLLNWGGSSKPSVISTPDYYTMR